MKNAKTMLHKSEVERERMREKRIAGEKILFMNNFLTLHKIEKVISFLI
jgi:hypothetical protein